MSSRRTKIMWELRRAAGIPTSNVDAAPISAHLRGLMLLGFSTTAIASSAGVSHATVREIAAGSHSPTRPVERVRRATAVRLEAVTPSHVFEAADLGHMVASYAAKRRLRALQAIGWTLAHIDAALPDGKRATNILEAGLSITAESHRAACTAYRAIAMTPGPSLSARTWAARRGSPPPLAWDDIDHPEERAALGIDYPDSDTLDMVAVQRALAGDQLPLSRAERREVTRILTSRGVGARDIAELVDVDGRTITRWRAEFRQETAA